VLPEISECILKHPAIYGYGFGWEERRIHGFHVRAKNPKMSEIRQVICQSEPLHIVDIQAIHVNANAYPEIEANT